MATHDIKYLETVGGSVRIHLDDGRRIDAYPDGRGRFLPRDGATAPVTPDPEDPTAPPNGSWVRPLVGGVATSEYGPRAFDGVASFHYGLDLANPEGQGGIVRAVTDMVITVAQENGTGNSTAGTYVKGHTLNGSHTFNYYHGQAGTLSVHAGQTVAPGTKLFIEGATGNVTGQHLHFEVYTGNYSDPWPPPYGPTPIDPRPFLESHGIVI